MSDQLRSEQMWQDARSVIPKGTHSDSRSVEPHPLYVERAEGAFVYDVDGKRWLDCRMGNGAIILGHGAPEVNAAMVRALNRGLGAGDETDFSVEAALRMHRMLPGADMVRFANTGTEAAMHALMMARAKTGRERIAKPEGGYDGWYDFLWVSTWPSAATMGPADAPASPISSNGVSRHAAETLTLPFNNLPATERLLRANAADLAAFILEPIMIDIGYVPAEPAYLRGVREITRELGIVLIFDELLTGFRLPGNNAADLYDVQPDLSIYGKAIGNGQTVAAVAGPAAFMMPPSPPQYVGTFNSHAIAMAAVCATLECLAGGGVYTRLEALTEQLRQGFQGLSRRHSIPVQLQGRGGHFNIYFNPEPITDYRTAMASSAPRYVQLARQLGDDGIIIAGKYLLHNAFSYAHTSNDVDQLLASADRALRQMK
jgi:glutamate-1-semialdehyde 2,1-aminomutase